MRLKTGLLVSPCHLITTSSLRVSLSSPPTPPSHLVPSFCPSTVSLWFVTVSFSFSTVMEVVKSADCSGLFKSPGTTITPPKHTQTLTCTHAQFNRSILVWLLCFDVYENLECFPRTTHRQASAATSSFTSKSSLSSSCR